MMIVIMLTKTAAVMIPTIAFLLKIAAVKYDPPYESMTLQFPERQMYSHF